MHNNTTTIRYFMRYFYAMNMRHIFNSFWCYTQHLYEHTVRKMDKNKGEKSMLKWNGENRSGDAKDGTWIKIKKMRWRWEMDKWEFVTQYCSQNCLYTLFHLIKIFVTLFINIDYLYTGTYTLFIYIFLSTYLDIFRLL